jgi:addiction module HigA family antidote
MIPLNRIPTHPGEILLLEYLEPLSITQAIFARHIGLSLQYVHEIITGKQRITPETAWLFAQAFKTTPQFWLNLQQNYDLATCRPVRQVAPLLQIA